MGSKQENRHHTATPQSEVVDHYNDFAPSVSAGVFGGAPACWATHSTTRYVQNRHEGCRSEGEHLTEQSARVHSEPPCPLKRHERDRMSVESPDCLPSMHAVTGFRETKHVHALVSMQGCAICSHVNMSIAIASARPHLEVGNSNSHAGDVLADTCNTRERTTPLDRLLMNAPVDMHMPRVCIRSTSHDTYKPRRKSSRVFGKKHRWCLSPMGGQSSLAGSACLCGRASGK